MARWRDVEDAWDYQVSEEGEVRNSKTGRILKPYKNPVTGVNQVTLMDDGRKLTRSTEALRKRAFDW